MTRPTESSVEVKVAVKWWLDRIGDEAGDDEPMSLFSLAQNNKAEGLIKTAVLDCIPEHTWRPGNWWWGNELRKFGTSPTLPDKRNLAKRVLEPLDLTLNVTEWPESAVMYVDPGRVFVQIDDRRELIYGYWKEDE